MSIKYPDKAYDLEANFRKHANQFFKADTDLFIFGIAQSAHSRGGISDYIGIKRVGVQDLIDAGIEDIGVFVAIEAKAKNGKPTRKQRDFILKVHRLSGLAGIAKTINDIKEILNIKRMGGSHDR